MTDFDEKIRTDKIRTDKRVDRATRYGMLFGMLVVLLGATIIAFMPHKKAAQPKVVIEAPVATTTMSRSTDSGGVEPAKSAPGTMTIDPPMPYSVYGTSISTDNIYNGVNWERYTRGLPILKRNEKLDQAAMLKLADMIGNKYFAHESPRGFNHQDFIDSTGYKRIYSGENLARDFATNQETVAAWMESPTHKDNILNPHYKDTGVATYGSLVVQIFGSED